MRHTNGRLILSKIGGAPQNLNIPPLHLGRSASAAPPQLLRLRRSASAAPPPPLHFGRSASAAPPPPLCLHRSASAAQPRPLRLSCLASATPPLYLRHSAALPRLIRLRGDASSATLTFPLNPPLPLRRSFSVGAPPWLLRRSPSSAPLLRRSPSAALPQR